MTKPTTVSHPRRVYYVYTRTQKFSKSPGLDSTVYGESSKSWTDTKTGSNLPGWRARVARNLDATTTFSGSRRKIKKRYGYIGISYLSNIDGEVTKSFYRDIAYPTASPSTTGISTTSADNIAKSKFIKRCIEAQQSFNGTGFLAELGETLRMIGRPLPAIKNHIRSFADTVNTGIKRGTLVPKGLSRTKRISRFGDLLSDLWLTKSFGIDPLLSDVDDAMKALAQSQYERRNAVQAVRARGKTENNTLIASQTHPGSPSLIVSRWQTYSTTTAEVIYRGAIVRRTTSDKLPTYNEIFGLRARDVIPGIWQGIPWSWLVDYVTNVDDILTAYSFQRTDLAWCNRTIRKSDSRYISHLTSLAEMKKGVEQAGHLWYGGSYDASSFEDVLTTTDRASYTGSLVPTFEFDLLNAATIRRLTNLSAVAWSRKNLLVTIRNAFRR